MNKYLLAFRMALRDQLTNPSGWALRLSLFAVLLLIFSRLWESAFLSVAGGGSAASLTWYMALTEIVAVSIPMIHLEIETMVRRGDVAYELIRPASFVGLAFARGLGQATSNFIVIGTLGFAIVYFFAGGLPEDPRWLLIAMPIAYLGLFIATIVQVAIGLSSFWIQDASPLYWVWQKCCFILGGLILPLTFYPGWLYDFAMWTPFTAILYRPARIVIDGPSDVVTTMITQSLWGAIFFCALVVLYRRAVRVLDVNGG